MPLGCTNKVTIGVKLLQVTVCLTRELWLFVHFNEYTMDAFPVKCMEEPAFDSLSIPITHFNPSHPPTPYKLNPWYWRGLEKVSEIPTALAM